MYIYIYIHNHIHIYIYVEVWINNALMDRKCIALKAKTWPIHNKICTILSNHLLSYALGRTRATTATAGNCNE